MYWVVPESVRWLIGAGRLEEAKAIIENAAKANGREAPVHLFKSAAIVSSDLENSKHAEAPEVKATVLDLFRPTKMALRTINMCFQVDNYHETREHQQQLLISVVQRDNVLL